ncbi:hypothetical protein ACYPKM_02935 [Pseudomonas aeruginosa]
MTKDVQEPQRVVMQGYRGALIIGDPSLGGAKRVGRVDDIWESAVAKLQQAFEIAKERKLVPIIVGELLHESRDIGQLLPIINILNTSKAILVPKNCAWQEQAQGHIAAVLKAAGVAYIAGDSGDRFQLIETAGGKVSKLEIDCYTAWGGVERLDFGSKAHLKFRNLNVGVVQSNTLPILESEGDKTLIVAGRLLRMGPVEESLNVYVYEVTQDGIEAIPLEVRPIVFSGASGIAEESNIDLRNMTLFIEQLKASAAEAAEETGKGTLLTLVNEVTEQEKSDEWMVKLLNELAHEVITQDATSAE